ncbi:hypothetical protein AAFF_G00248430 [Aldrovandia affinis]|uniref:Uncharacterized protein n=1 Tax=Aldrovandia affinis TaxID=143900 RepID=A0AAD7QZT9_9TELE|nr:hypothetical protein AAFF_G00248430 [Aldrovandia affinis]
MCGFRQAWAPDPRRTRAQAWVPEAGLGCPRRTRPLRAHVLPQALPGLCAGSQAQAWPARLRQAWKGLKLWYDHMRVRKQQRCQAEDTASLAATEKYLWLLRFLEYRQQCQCDKLVFNAVEGYSAVSFREPFEFAEPGVLD